MPFRFAGFAVLKQCKRARRIIVYRAAVAHQDKARANRAYRRALKRQVAAGVEASSEFDPSRRCFLTAWDIC